MAADIFLKLSKTEGESTDDKHKNEIQIMSFSWGASNPVSSTFGTGMSVGKATLSDVSFTKTMDKSSSVMFKHMCTGTHLDEALFTFRKSGDADTGNLEYLKIKLTDVMVSGVTFADHGGSDLGMESWSMTYVAVSFEYKPVDNKGKLGTAVTAGWDQKANKPT